MGFIKNSLLLLAVPALAAPATPASLFERQAASCTLPADYSPPTVSKLPDPFIKANGDKVATLDDWKCRQQEIAELVQKYEMGYVPPKPSTFSASLSGNRLTINFGDGGKSASFSVTISKPSGTGPFPAIIAYGGASIPIPNTVASINFDNSAFGAQNGGGSRGQGIFYNVYGSGHSAGSMAAWAYGVSRIIDALESVGSAASGIDTTRIGVTGCSRNGKGAFMAGAFDSRVALTIPQESGAGGASCWRVADAEKKAGKNIQTAGQIIGENPWMGKVFDSYASNVARLPHDHHELAALVAPRGLYVIENDIDWLGPGSTNVCMKAARLIYKAVGAADAMGFSQAAAHSHCVFPSSQQSELTAFINKYLLKGTGDTNIEKGTVNSPTVATWVDWTPPTLS